MYNKEYADKILALARENIKNKEQDSFELFKSIHFTFINSITPVNSDKIKDYVDTTEQIVKDISNFILTGEGEFEDIKNYCSILISALQHIIRMHQGVYDGEKVDVRRNMKELAHIMSEVLSRREINKFKKEFKKCSNDKETVAVLDKWTKLMIKKMDAILKEGDDD